LNEIIRLERRTVSNRLWTPASAIFSWHHQDISENLEHDDDEDPGTQLSALLSSLITLHTDVIQGTELAWKTDLGMPRARDPDALPPRNGFEWAMNHIYLTTSSLGRGNVLFAIKAGILTS